MLGKDFMVEIICNVDGEIGFKVSFIGVYVKISDVFYIIYIIFFDVIELDVNNFVLDYYWNIVVIDWMDEVGNNYYLEDSKLFKFLFVFDLNV